ncbi:MAG TPA: hypothetical protein VHU80_04350 [Polyangiaceae bacterium]|jgi:hypothetical protein|nr:hypothetical protein [Polyangiaceae bacterium]
MTWQTLEPDRAWMLSYAFDKKGNSANSCAVKLREGELLVICPAAGVSQSDFAEIEKHGRPAAIVAPNAYHHLGIPEWSRRYPEAKLYASSSAARRIAKKYPDARAFQSLSDLATVLPSDVVVLEPPGMRIPDVMARVATPSGWLWSMNDTVMNIPQLPAGFFGKVMKWTDSGPGFKVARFFTMMALKEKRRFKEWWLEELGKAPPSKVTTGHGAPVLDSSVAAKLPDMVKNAL